MTLSAVHPIADGSPIGAPAGIGIAAKAPHARIHWLFEAQVARTPTAVAVVHEERHWSYAQLDAAATRIARGLEARLDCDGALIGVSTERSLDMLACLLGVMKAGAAYLPLDPDLPPGRLQQIVADASPELVIGSAAALRAIDADVNRLSLDALRDGAPVATVEPRHPLERIGGHLAYVMYTSGSTGRPKGVEIDHASVVNLLASIQAEPGFGPDDILLAATRMSFDVSVLDFFLPLSCGARIVIASQAVAADPIRLAELIEQSAATVMQATPTTWRALVDTGWKGRPSLRIWCGGEALTGSLADRLVPRAGEVWNMYGPTETTVWSTVGRITGSSVPLGQPIARTTLFVVDAALNLVSDGAPGELCIGGAGLARGYRGRPDLTAERFVVLPAATERVYRTGDLVRRDEAGDLQYLGRIDSQVKIRGHRVEMGELEAVVEQHADVAACAVRCWPDAIGEVGLFAYIVARPGAAAALPAAVQAHVRGLLPDYMVPHRIFVIDRLPLNSSCKVDRNALPPPAEMPDQAVDLASAALPQGAVEETLAAIWSDLLGVRRVAGGDDFFDLGGYSLLTVHLVCRIEETFGRRLSMADLFATPTLTAMAQLITTTADADPDRLVPLQPFGSRPPLLWLDAGPLLRPMARAIGADQPVFGVNLSGEMETRLGAAGFDVPRLAAVVVERLRQVAPDGPYYLGGWCRWGVVAYEVACQLRASGGDVRLVVLLDAENPAWRPRGVARRTVGNARRAWRRWRRPPPASFSQMVEASLGAYRPGRYAGDVALMRPEAVYGTGPDGGWGARIGGNLTLYTIPGDHLSMMRGAASETLGAAIATALTRAQGTAAYD